MSPQRSQIFRHRRLGVALVAMGALFSPAAARAQTTSPVAPKILVHGEVLDANTGFPVPDAFVELVSENLRTFADSAGYFRFPDVGEGRHQVRVTQLGYVTLSEHSELLAYEALTIWLTPRPLELEGIVVTVNRLERRRRAFARSVRALDSKAVQTSGAFDALELLERIPGGRTIPCGLSDCILSRGRFVPLRVMVDEMRAFGGAQALEGYPTSEIHSIEFIPSCSMVRVYTRHFIEKMGRRGGRAFFTNLCSAF